MIQRNLNNMKPNPSLQMPENQSQQRDQTIETKTFVQDIFKLNYTNTSKIVNDLTSHTAQVKITNHLCYQEGNNLYKVTEIVYEDKIIRIEDKFQVGLDPEQGFQSDEKNQIKQEKDEKKCMRNVEKVRMFNKNLNKQGKNGKKDKKNIVKNVIKIFHAWLDKKVQKSSSTYILAFEQLQKLLQEQNYNNRLIKKITENKQISREFLKFLEDDAQNEIKFSRIQDKDSHYEALKIYKDLLSGYDRDPQYKQERLVMHSEPQIMARGDFQMSSPNKQQNSDEQNNDQFDNYYPITLRSKDRKNQKNKNKDRKLTKSQEIVNFKQSSN